MLHTRAGKQTANSADIMKGIIESNVFIKRLELNRLRQRSRQSDSKRAFLLEYLFLSHHL